MVQQHCRGMTSAGIDAWQGHNLLLCVCLRPTFAPCLCSVISGVDLLRHPKYNKGLAFQDDERDRLYLRGLLPPAIISQDVQVGSHS